MIIVICTDDEKLARVAEAQANNDPEIYGRCWRVFAAEMPALGVAEDLYVTAHGAKQGDDGNPVIGSKKNALYLNAAQLALNIENLLPANYKGRIFISACESADDVQGSFSFAEAFKNIIAPTTQTAGVYGQRGCVGLTIPPRSSPGWTQA